MKFDTKDIKARSKRNFEETWLDTAKLLNKTGGSDYLKGKGKPHILHEMIANVRKILLDIGFDEVENSMFIPEDEIYWQYGPEAPVILDRCYYLAGLTRPDIGLGKDKIKRIHEIGEGIDIAVLQEILRGYREGSIEGDNLFEEMVSRLGIKTEEAARVVDLFPEFRKTKPVAERMTLRSHMTGVWFPTLRALQYREEMPVKAFSIGVRFRREQKVDSTHLRAHYGASCVIMDPEITLEAGNRVAEEIFKRLDFTDIRYEIKKATSNYYAPETELEVFSGDIEVGDCGLYSPVALANYGIEYPVYNIGFGLERILMIKNKITDIREAIYPQFYTEYSLSDGEIVGQIQYESTPKTPEGISLASAIRETAKKNADKESPCSVRAYSGDFLGKTLEVDIVEKESGTRLLGPAALNNLYVHDSGIYAIPEGSANIKEELREITKKGLKSEINFLDAAANEFAATIENEAGRDGGDKTGTLCIKMVKTPADVNISISEMARRYIMSKNKPITVKGPVFISVEYSVK